MKLPLHVPIDGFDVHQDCLMVDGRSIEDIAREVGRTPFFLYSRALIGRRVDHLRSTLPAGIEIHYAMKANPMAALVAHMATLVDGIDVASAGELRVALKAGMAANRISFAGPGKSMDELQAALSAGIVVNVESPGELRRLVDLGEANGQRPRVAIRVNPDFELKGAGVKTAGGSRQFGIDAEQVPEVLGSMADMDLEFQGIHVFSGSQNLHGPAIAEAQIRSMALALRLCAFAPAPPGFINLGGGFGIPYFPGEKPLDLSPVASALAECKAALTRAYPGAALVLELGRYLVGEAGLYVCRIIDRKISRGRVFLVTDGGLHHHLAASGNFGQVIRRNYPLLMGNRVRGNEREIATIVGRLCTSLDVLGNGMEVAKAEPGDLVVIFQSGAYGYTASPVNFLSHPGPGEIFL